MTIALTRIGAGHDGECDRCRIAMALRAAQPDDDAARAQSWRTIAAWTCDLFDDPNWRSATNIIARALLDKTMLTGAEIDELLNGLDLRAALRGAETMIYLRTNRAANVLRLAQRAALSANSAPPATPR